MYLLGDLVYASQTDPASYEFGPLPNIGYIMRCQESWLADNRLRSGAASVVPERFIGMRCCLCFRCFCGVLPLYSSINWTFLLFLGMGVSCSYKLKFLCCRQGTGKINKTTMNLFKVTFDNLPELFLKNIQ